MRAKIITVRQIIEIFIRKLRFIQHLENFRICANFDKKWFFCLILKLDIKIETCQEKNEYS